MSTRHAEGTFTVDGMQQVEIPHRDAVVTALPVGIATMVKSFDGDVRGRATTLFTAAFDQAAGRGTYIAMESFEGVVLGARGSFNFIHTASTTGQDRSHEFFLVVPGSGTDELAGISGTGAMSVDPDGTHRIELDIDL